MKYSKNRKIKNEITIQVKKNIIKSGDAKYIAIDFFISIIVGSIGIWFLTHQISDAFSLNKFISFTISTIVTIYLYLVAMNRRLQEYK